MHSQTSQFQFHIKIGVQAITNIKHKDQIFNIENEKYILNSQHAQEIDLLHLI